MRRLVPLVFSLWLVWLPARAQSPTPASMTLVSVEVTGLARYTRDEVVKASGLAIDSRVGIADIEAAADRLSRSGLVTRVAFRYSFKGDALSVTFDVAEATLEEDVIFDNFPWFTDDALVAAIGRDLPGFAGQVAGVAGVLDRIEQRLEELLAGRKVAGGVSYSQYLDASSGRSAHLFTADSRLPICRVALGGSTVAFGDELSRATTPLVKRDYSRVNVATFTRTTLVPMYRQRGFLRARAEGNHASIAESLDGCTGVEVTVAVDEGVAYSWQGASWSGTTVFAASALDGMLQVSRGDVADGLKLDAGLAAVARAFGRKGYLSASTVVTPTFAERDRTVRYDIVVADGPQYHMGSVTFLGTSAAVAKELLRRWRLQAGAIYDADYVSEFQQAVGKDAPQLLAGVSGIEVGVTPRPMTTLVDVAITLR